MRQSKLFTKTSKENPKDEQSKNAQLLERAGFIYKNSAGIYTILPLGWRVIQKIAAIIREEINAIGGQEMLMQAMVDKHYLKATGRWDIDIGFKIITAKNPEPSFVLGWTHEEVVTEIAARFINSYRDLPLAVYQIQTKFRNEARAKSGILRGREFLMKDLYSFHADERDLLEYYEKAKQAYFKIFERCGLRTYYTLAGGGDFTAGNTHEFQVLAPVGEDVTYYCEKCGYAENKEISKLKAGDKCPGCGGKIGEANSIEVGNIFPLGTKYSEALGLAYADEKGNRQPVVMGSYGIGLGRMMGAIVEIHNDDKGIIWPEAVAPFKVHLIALEGAESEADKFYDKLIKAGIDVFYDDRAYATAGEKFNDADLIGIPCRLVISKKTLENDGVEIKKRFDKIGEIAKMDATIDILSK
ncbi:MAG: prolyl-tRNA synthetase [Parcubacteria group bacterium Licking1014_17]|nr:MAG: prolyl-tRNA synthetase [Parcubacteria group bacterium Licking1014_17]